MISGWLLRQGLPAAPPDHRQLRTVEATTKGHDHREYALPIGKSTRHSSFDAPAMECTRGSTGIGGQHRAPGVLTTEISRSREQIPQLTRTQADSDVTSDRRQRRDL